VARWPGLLQQAAPVLVAVAGPGPQLCGQRPTLAQAPPQGDGGPSRGRHEVKAASDLRATLLGQRLQVGGGDHARGSCRGKPPPGLRRGGAGAVGDVWADRGVPVGAGVIAPRPTEGSRTAYGAAASMTRDRIGGERIRAVTMRIRALHSGQQLAHLRPQGSSEDQHGIGLRTADCRRLLKPIRDPPVLAAVVEPRRCREDAREVGCIGAGQHTAGAVGQAWGVEDQQPRQVRLDMTQLAPMLQEIAQAVRRGGPDGSRGDNGKLPEAVALAS
jgi:hypothetical protein